MFMPEKERTQRAAIAGGIVCAVLVAVAIVIFFQTRQTTSARLLLTFVITSAFMLPVVAYYFTARRLAAQSFKDAASWPQVRGEMIRQGVITVDTGDGTQEEADFAYRFVVDGVTHVGTTIRPGPRFAFYLPPEVYRDEYKPGREVRVYVNPADRSESVLDPNLEQGTREVLATFVGMPVLVTLLVWLFL